MKRNLFLIRHASTEEGGSSGVHRDFDRELTSKGIMEAAKVGKYLSEEAIDAVYTSGARRAVDTAKYLCEQINFDDLVANEGLYSNGPRGYLDTLSKIPEENKNVVIVGHNPDITYFAEFLLDSNEAGYFDNATIVKIGFEKLNWDEISKGSGTFIKRSDI